MKRKTGIIEWAMHYRQIILLVTGLLIIAGIYSLIVMPKQEFPEFVIRQGVVVGVYPGASSKNVEEQLTKPLEKYLLSFPEVNRKKTYSQSKDGMVFVFVELADNVNNKDEVWSKIKHGLKEFKSSLPSGVLALIANDNFGDVASLLISLESDDKTYREMDSYIDQLEQRLRQVPSVANLNRYGTRKEQISIYLDKDKLSAYGVGPSIIMMNLFTQGLTTMSGTLSNTQIVSPIYISEAFRTEKEIEEQIIYNDPEGNVIRIKDVARVVREYPDADNYITNNGKKSVILSVEIRHGENIIAFGKDVDKVLKQFQNELPKSVSMYRIVDQPDVVAKSINTFLKELLMAIIAVILVTMVLLPFRVAAVAATSIPISIFIALAFMFGAGIPLNMVTLAALIIVLGMIVDNSIVIVDSYLEKLDHGISRWHASIASAKEYFKSIFSSTLAISITFFPFLFTMKGTMYDFLQYFPWTISITLGVSLLVAMLVIPIFQYFLITKGLKQSKKEKVAKGKKDRKSILDYLQIYYEKLLSKSFEYPKTTLLIALMSIIVAVILFTVIPQRMMPVVERNQFAVEIYLPQGTALSQTTAVCDSMENILRKDKRVKSITAFVGSSSPRFHAVYAPNMPSKGYGQFIVNTYTSKETEAMLDEYTNNYAFHFSSAYIRFKQLDFQAVAAPIEVRFSGENIAELKAQSEKLIDRINTFDELLFVRTNFEEMQPGVQIDIDPTEASRLGINKALVSMNVASEYSGIPITTLWEDDYPVTVELKSENTKPNFQDIGNVNVSGIIPGSTVPLHQVANITPQWTQGQIVHRNGILTLSVLADVKRGESTKEVFAKVKDIMNKEIVPNMPGSVKMEYGGQEELDAEVMEPMMKAMLVSVVIIFFILFFHFKRINMASLVLGSAVLSFFGAAFGVWVMGIDFSVTAMLGIVSLVGIIVRNGIIMFDYAEVLRFKQKMPIREASIEAAKRRMRPIFLTSAAASMGVLPMIISKNLLWSPLGTVIFFGTMISMVFVLTVLPVAYWMIFRKADKLRINN